MRRTLLAIVGAILVTLIGHGVFVALVLSGAPCLNTLYPGPAPMWLCHITRFVFYLAVGAAAIWTWRAISTRTTPLPYAFLVAAIVWTYWYVLDPGLLVREAGASRLGTWLMEYTYGTPLGELYWGWGFAKYHVWLAVGQGLLTAATLLLISKARPAEVTNRRE